MSGAPTQAALLELAARVEAASGPDRELDALIEKTLPCSPDFARHHVGKSLSQWNENAFAFYCPSDEGRDYISPAYTASLDAAMTLVPEGGVWAVLTDFELPGRARVHVRPESPVFGRADAATPALALTAAALRSRAAQGDPA